VITRETTLLRVTIQAVWCACR